MTFNRELQYYRRHFTRIAQPFFREKRREIGTRYPALLPLFDDTAEFVLRPKSSRLRGFLLVLGYQLLHGRNKSEALRLSIIPELYQASLLIHDDIIDRDNRRRGGPTLHVAMRRASAHQENREHYGLSQAILFGNLLGIWSRQLVSSCATAPAVKLKMQQCLERMWETTHYGQALDVLLAERQHATVEEVVTVYRRKTAVYTMETPLHLGALFAGATAAELRRLSTFALPVGLAFQIQDDYLGLFGDPVQTGKPVGSDFEEGKQTIFLSSALAILPKSQATRLRRLSTQPGRGQSEFRQARRLIVASGAPEMLEHYASQLVDSGKRALVGARQFDVQYATLLAAVADFIVHRGV